MRSWLVIGPASWLLGALIATAGSLYAIDQVGRGLLGLPANRVTIAIVNSELARASSEHAVPVATRARRESSSASPAMRAAAMVPAGPRRRRPAGGPLTVIDTAGGSAEVACEQGAAYLLYEIPKQGFTIRDLRRGPVSAASVTFRNSTGGLVLRVTCTDAGYPLKHVSAFRQGSG